MNGPAAACILSIRRVGWWSEDGLTLTTADGDEVVLTLMPPKLLEGMLEHAVLQLHRREAVLRASRSFSHVGKQLLLNHLTPLLQPTPSTANSLTGAERNCLWRVASGSYLSKDRVCK